MTINDLAGTPPNPEAAISVRGLVKRFGSFTAVRDREADGFGVHQDGRWRVVLGAPVGVVNGALNVGESQVAFAVWEGAAQNVGGRKMRSEAWVRLVVA